MIGIACVAGSLFKVARQPLPDTRQPNVPECVFGVAFYDHFTLAGLSAFCHDDDGRITAFKSAFYPFNNLIHHKWCLRDEDDVGTTCHACRQRDPPCVPAHHLEDQHSFMGLCRCM